MADVEPTDKNLLERVVNGHVSLILYCHHTKRTQCGTVTGVERFELWNERCKINLHSSFERGIESNPLVMHIEFINGQANFNGLIPGVFGKVNYKRYVFVHMLKIKSSSYFIIILLFNTVNCCTVVFLFSNNNPSHQSN